MSSWRRFAPAALLSCVLAGTALIYLPGLYGGYAFDDFPNIVDNDPLHVTTLAWDDWWAAMLSSPAKELLRPLSMLSFAVNYFLTGADPFFFKLTNLLVHLGNVVLAYALAFRLFAQDGGRFAERETAYRDRTAALLLAALWAVAPINLSPVLLVVQRMESLAQAFVYAGLIAYAAGRRRQLAARPGWLLIVFGTVVCTGAGLLAKETAVALPLYALLVELLLFGFRNAAGRRDRTLLAYFAVIFVVPLVVGSIVVIPWALSPAAYARRSFDVTERLLTEGRVLWDYMQWTLMPRLGVLSLYHDDVAISRGIFSPPSTSAALVGLAALFFFACIVRRRRPLAALGIFLFLSAHALTGTVIPLELVYEHRNYFASFGLLLAVVDLAIRSNADTPRLSGSVALSFVLAYFSLTTCLRAKEWGDPIRFSISEAEKQPGSPRALYDVGRTYVVLSGYDPHSPFVPIATSTLEKAAGLPGAGVLPEQALLILAARSNAPSDPEWWHSMQEKLRKNPIGVQETGALHSLVKCELERKCRFAESDMLETFYSAMEAKAPRPDVLIIFSDFALNVLKDYPLALRLTEDAIEASPKNFQYRENMAKILIFLGSFDDAARAIDRMQALDTNGAERARIQAMQTRLNKAQAERDKTGVPAARPL